MYNGDHTSVCPTRRDTYFPSETEAVWFFSLTMLAVLIYELVVNQKAQGTPVSFHVRIK